MTGTCEVLSILMLVGATGSNGLESRCVPSMEACNARWREAVKQEDAGAILGQCIVIDDFVAMRDAGRAKK